MEQLSFYRNIIVAIFCIMPLVYLPAQQKPGVNKMLQQEYDMVPPHVKDTQYYMMESKLLRYDLDGLEGDEYTCMKFTVQLNNSPEIAIPSLANWKYFFTLAAGDKDEKGQVLGVDHSKFEKLADENGKILPAENTYHVYNAFIDFHSMSVFTEKTIKGKGAQDLKQVGQKIIHGASFSQPPVNLGSQIAEGSYFKNGEITLTFKGLSLVNNKTCALLGYDSGESSFYMLIKPMANMEVKTKGSSHYQGDIYKDLYGGWIQKATLHEIVISETVVPGQPKNANNVIERSININNVGKNKF
jgi:hypothetical protein